MLNEMVSRDDAPSSLETGTPGPAADENRFWTNRAAEIYRAGSSYFDTNVRNRIIQDIRQFQSLHPTGSKYFTDSYRLKSKMFRPKTRAAIRKGEATAAAAYFSTEDVVSVRPVDDNDPLHQAAAAFHRGLLQYRLTRPHPHGIPWFLTCMGAYQETQAVGVVASYQDWDKKLDRPDITLLPVENYGFDPAADWRDPVNTSPYFYITWPMYVKDVVERMRQGVWKPASSGVILSAATQHANDTIRQQREERTDSKDNPTSLKEYQIVWVHENFEEIPGVGDVVYYTLGTQHLLSKPVLVEERYPQGRPVVIGFSIVEAHKVYPSSKSTLTRGPQEEINEVANLRLDSVKLALNGRYLVAKGRGTDLRSLTRNVSGSVTLTENPNADVVRMKVDDATASSYQEQNLLNLDFDDMAGAFSGSSVQSNRSLNETVGGMNLLAVNSNQIAEYELRTFTETWVERVLRQVVVLEQYYEDNPQVLTICGRQAALDKYGLDLTDRVVLRLITQDVLLTVNVGVGAVNPQSQLERFMFAMGSLGKLLGNDFLHRPLTEQEQEIVKEVFGKCGYKDGARFLMKSDKEQDPMITRLTAKIQELQQALEMKHPPELVAAQVAKANAEAALKTVETVNKRVEALFAAMNTAQTAVTVPGVTTVADAIARSAGFEDQDGGETVPQTQVQQIPQVIPQNTSPGFPARPDHGMMTGIEGGA